jgi:hypothetical protein
MGKIEGARHQLIARTFICGGANLDVIRLIIKATKHRSKEDLGSRWTFTFLIQRKTKEKHHRHREE